MRAAMRHKQMYKPVLLVLKNYGGRDVRALSAYPLCWAETVSLEGGESAIPALDTLTKRLRRKVWRKWSLAWRTGEDLMFC